MAQGVDLGKRIPTDFDELVEVQYVPRKLVSRMIKSGWETVGAAVGTPSKWSVLMIRSHLNNKVFEDEKQK